MAWKQKPFCVECIWVITQEENKEIDKHVRKLFFIWHVFYKFYKFSL